MDIFERNHIDVTKLAKRENVIYQYTRNIRWRYLYLVLGYACLSKYSFKTERCGSRIVFLKGASSSRKNEEAAYEKLRKCAKEHDEICLSRKTCLSNIPYNIYLIFKYTVIYIRQKKDMMEILITLRNLLQTRSFLTFLEKQPLNTYSAGIVYNDLDPYDNLFVQYLKNKGIKTVTCQHGIFNAPNDSKELTGSGVELKESIADIFLAWNEMTYDEGIKAGAAKEKFKILGIPKCIGMVPPKRPAQDKFCFGVILNFKPLNDYNIKLIQIANQTAEIMGLKYYIKFHPNVNLNDYDNLIDTKYGTKLPLSISVADYADMVDFSLVSHSSVYTELIFLQSKVYVLDAGGTCRYYRFPEYIFSTADELIQLMQKEYDFNKVFKYYCYSEDPQGEYSRFFAELKAISPESLKDL